MAELHVQRKRNNYWWLWLLLIVIIAAAIYYYVNYYHKNENVVQGKITNTLQIARIRVIKITLQPTQWPVSRTLQTFGTT